MPHSRKSSNNSTASAAIFLSQPHDVRNNYPRVSSSQGTNNQTRIEGHPYAVPTLNAEDDGEDAYDKRKRQTAVSVQSFPMDADDYRWSNAPVGVISPTSLASLNYKSSTGMRVSMAGTLPHSNSQNALDSESQPGSPSNYSQTTSPQLPNLSFEMSRSLTDSSDFSLPYLSARASTAGSITPVRNSTSTIQANGTSHFYEDGSAEGDDALENSSFNTPPAKDKQYLAYQGKKRLPLPGEPSPSSTFRSASPDLPEPISMDRPPVRMSSIKGKTNARDSIVSNSYESEIGENNGWDAPDEVDTTLNSRRQSRMTDSRRWSRADMLSDRQSREIYAGYASEDVTAHSGVDATFSSTLELSAFPEAPSGLTIGKNTDQSVETSTQTSPKPVETSLSVLDFDFGSSSLFSDFDLGLDALGAGLRKRSITPTRVSSDTVQTSTDSESSGKRSTERLRKDSTLHITRKQPPKFDEAVESSTQVADDVSKRSSVVTVRDVQSQVGHGRPSEFAGFANNQSASREFPVERPLSPAMQQLPESRASSRQTRTHSRTTSISSQISALLGRPSTERVVTDQFPASKDSSRQHSRNPSATIHHNTADSSIDGNRVDREFTSTPPLFAFRRRESVSSALSGEASRARSPVLASSMSGQLEEAYRAQTSRIGQSNSSLLSANNLHNGRPLSANSDINKSLPPTPAPLRMFSMPTKGSRPSFPERASSIRKTSANLISKGKSFMSRSHANLAEAAQPQQQPEIKGIEDSRGRSFSKSSGLSTSSTWNKSNSDQDAASYFSDQQVKHSPPSKPRLSVRRSMDMLRNKVKGSTTSTETANPQPEPVEDPRAAVTRKKLSAVPPAPVLLSESTRRPSTDKLLMLASQKLAQLAVDKSADSSYDSHDTEQTPISPVSTVSTDISCSTNHQKDGAEVYSVARAVRVNRQDPKGHQPSANDTIQTATVEGAAQTSVTIQAAPKLVPRRQPGSIDLKSALSPTQTTRKSPSSNFATSIAGLPRSGSFLRSATTANFPQTPQPPPILWKKRAANIDEGSPTRETMAESWTQLEEALGRYIEAYQNGDSERPAIAQSSLIAFLKRADNGHEKISPNAKVSRRQHAILFSWFDVLLDELKSTPANRGVCLDGVAAILESSCLSSDILKNDAEVNDRFTETLIAALAFAIDKLNEKAVYANTLSFSGRLFAVAFFRIEGIGLKLLRLLPQVKRQDLKRILNEAGVRPTAPPPIRLDIFPAHLESLCYKQVNEYASLLSPMTPAEGAVLVQSEEHTVKMQGNWLIRWQASDSDLPFAFYRAYHRQLAGYLQLPQMADPSPEAFISTYEAISAPGFVFVAASLLEKIDSLIHRNLRSVTTLGPNSGSFSTQDSANMTMGAKPKVLEMANRRVVSTVLDVVGGPARPKDAEPVEGDAEPESRIRRHLFGGILQILLRAVVKRTSLFDARGVFLLLDFIEGLFYTVCATPTAAADLAAWHPSPDTLTLFDTNFILSFVRTLFLKADNTICLMRTFTFLYAQFESFTIRAEDRFELCQRILLHPDIFQRMFLYWNMSVRGYFVRLIVWRLSRLGTSSDGRPRDTKDPHTIFILQTLNSRLEGIRKRHDEIDPLEDLPDDDLFDAGRLSIDSTRGVVDQLWIVDEILQKGSSDVGSEFTRSDAYDKVTPEDSRDIPDAYHGQSPNNAQGNYSDGFPHAVRDVATMSKVVNWLKVLKPGKKNGKQRILDDAHIEPFTLNDAPSDFRVIRPQEANKTHVFEAQGPSGDTQILSETEDQDTEQRHFPFSPILPERDAAFFSFEFEGDVPMSDTFEGRRSTRTSMKRTDRPPSQSQAGLVSPRRPVSMSTTASPRVSKRFSKRASILPPPALDLLMESSGPVPQVPKEFQNPDPYTMVQHAYAIRGLREYEDALDEYDVWIARVMENDEDLDGREQAELVPRLNVLWPLSFSED